MVDGHTVEVASQMLHTSVNVWVSRPAIPGEKQETELFIGIKMSHTMRNLFMPYANNKSADQPAPMHSLISTFVVR